MRLLLLDLLICDAHWLLFNCHRGCGSFQLSHHKLVYFLANIEVLVFQSPILSLKVFTFSRNPVSFLPYDFDLPSYPFHRFLLFFYHGVVEILNDLYRKRPMWRRCRCQGIVLPVSRWWMIIYSRIELILLYLFGVALALILSHYFGTT